MNKSHDETRKCVQEIAVRLVNSGADSWFARKEGQKQKKQETHSRDSWILEDYEKVVRLDRNRCNDELDTSQ